MMKYPLNESNSSEESISENEDSISENDGNEDWVPKNATLNNEPGVFMTINFTVDNTSCFENSNCAEQFMTLNNW